MRLRMVPANQPVGAELHGVIAADRCRIVRDLPTTYDGQAGKEDVGTELGESGNIQADFTRLIGNYVEVGVVVLRPRLVHGLGADLVEPRALDGVVQSMNRTAGGEADQRL